MCRAPAGPSRIRLSEARLLSLRRLLARLQAPQKQSHGALREQPVISDTSLRRDSHIPDQAASASQPAAQASPAGRGSRLQAAPIVLQNLCGLDLLIGQVGTEERVTIADGVSVPYR